jgi:hypothetical protein
MAKVTAEELGFQAKTILQQLGHTAPQEAGFIVLVFNRATAAEGDRPTPVATASNAPARQVARILREAAAEAERRDGSLILLS